MINYFNNHQGLTLIEVLVSIALIGIVAISIMGLFVTSLQNNHHSKALIENTILAKDVMENVKQEFNLLSSKNRDLNSLINKALEIQERYPHSSIRISCKDSNAIYQNLYIIEVDVTDIKEGSVETFVSQIYLP